MVTLKPNVSAALRDVILTIRNVKKEQNEENGDNIELEKSIPIGTQCKNNACKAVYEGVHSISESCTFHPGYPVFHEGLKFWTCCTKRTTDFDTFLSQVGCTSGTHNWFKKKLPVGEVKCRLDWHQTGTSVYVSIFGKKCDPDASIVELSPVRLKTSIYFPEQGGTYSKDMELCGIVDVAKSTVSMTPSKIEIKLHKKTTGSWSKLEISRPEAIITNPQQKENEEESLESRVESVDLNFI